MGIELKPCPFCGAQPEEQDIGSYFVECPGCGLQGPSGIRDGAESSVAAWNHRAVMAEVCRSQNAESERQDGLTLTDETQTRELAKDWGDGPGLIIDGQLRIINAQAERVAVQAALIEKFEKDASRYRWAISCDENAEILYSCAMCGIDPSAEIDAAIAAHKGAA